MDEPLRNKRPLVAVVGPTASGKSHLALRLAQRLNGEILNCDSVQVFRYFDIGTAKTPEHERRGIPHHLIDSLNPDEVFTAGDFSREGRAILSGISERGHLPIVSGGTGFYLRALIDGLSPGPVRNEGLRSLLLHREQRRSGILQRFLRRLDRASAARIHSNDLPKLIRALEICLAARQPAAEDFKAGRDPLQGYRVLKIGLFPDRESLYKRLEGRLEVMFSGGLEEEVKSILARGYSPQSKAFESIGYKQALQMASGDLTLKDALFYSRRDTRRYAKRQMTWFRQEPDLEFFKGFGDDPEIASRVEQRVGEFLIG